MKRKRPEVRFTERNDINKHLYCSICREVFNDPRHVSCGHTFCYLCIKTWLSNNIHCPECRSKVKTNDLKKNMIPKKIIDDYEVYCVHPECEWIGKLSSLDFHMKTCEKEKKKKRELNEEISKKICILVEDVKSEHEVINIEENELNDEISLNFSDDFPFLDSNPFLVDTSIVLRMTFNDKKSYGIINSFHI